ncbi:MAG: site-2 protease family protein [Acidobacteria bacterium]|nr:site-2 protease family protein [Acidobacteriota bacterium]MBU4253014.1 site-2 protease family protein [Acidobacteriota bacterium]
MKRGFRIGKIAGIDIHVDSSWFIIFVLFSWMLATTYFPGSFPGAGPIIYWLLGLVTSLLVFVSVLIHELAHSLVAIKQGEKVDRITLFILGGVAQITDEPKEPLSEFVMAVVGPLTSFILASFFFMLSLLFFGVSAALRSALIYLAIINTVLGLFNLIPGFPMDGGRVLRSILWSMTGDLRRATRIASLSGQAFSFLLVFLGILEVLRGSLSGLWLIFVGWFLQNAAVRGYRQVVMKTQLRGTKARDLMVEHFTVVDGGITVQILVDHFILKKKERIFLVGGEDYLRGIVCTDDVKKVPKMQRGETFVQDIMTPRDRLEFVGPDEDGEAILRKLAARDVNLIPVMDEEKLIGVICQSDLLRYIQLKNELKS